jgi:beta-galactosidase/beta-glucuronidase
LLDQGYWSDGLLTPPSDEAIVAELAQVKRLGFNMLRKHIKIEPLRWYYHCDRLGILVWPAFVNGGRPYSTLVTRYLPVIGRHLKETCSGRGFGRVSPEGRNVYKRDMKRTVDLLRNTVSIAVWVPFNEGWGQFESKAVTKMLTEMDSTRLIDHASGWHDQGCGDFASRHVYYKRFKMKPDMYKRVQALTEFGGYSLPVAGHMSSKKLFGYKKYKNAAAYNAALLKLYKTDVIAKKAQGLCAAVYTQLSDVEDEINGLFTYDREELKVDVEMIRAVNRELLKR